MNIKTLIVKTLTDLVKSSHNFSDWNDRMILVLLCERLQHDNCVRSDILESLSYTLVEDLDNVAEELGIENEVMNTAKAIDCESPESDIEERLRLPARFPESFEEKEKRNHELFLAKHPHSSIKEPIEIEDHLKKADYLTTQLTVFPSFQDLLDAPGYSPSFAVSLEPQALELADLYDAGQKMQGDNRRASRY